MLRSFACQASGARQAAPRRSLLSQSARSRAAHVNTQPAPSFSVPLLLLKAPGLPVILPRASFAPSVSRLPSLRLYSTDSSYATPPKTKAAAAPAGKKPKKLKEKKQTDKEQPLPPGTSLVVNLEDKRIEDAALGVRTFIINSVEAAKRFPVQVEAAVWPTQQDGRCSKCHGVTTPCVVTTFPLGETGAVAEAQSKVWSEYPVALDGVLCRSCSALTAPRFVKPEEAQKLTTAGLKEARARNFGMAEFLLRRCANAYPEYLYARLNLGSVFMDQLSTEEEENEELRKRLITGVKSNFEACLLPETKPEGRVPGKVYTTLARIYLSDADPLRAAKIMQRLLGVLEKAKKANDKGALSALDFSLQEDLTYAQSLLSKALAGMQTAAIKVLRNFAYYGDAEARLLSKEDHAVVIAAVDTLNLILACLQQPPERYGYLLNVDRYALYYFLGKAMQVLGDRQQAAGWFLEANKSAQLKERRIEAVTEYAGDFLHCRKPGEDRESIEKAIALVKETMEQCGDADGNLGSSLGMLYLAVGEAVLAEDVLQKCATDTGASLAQGLLAYIPSAKEGGSEKWRWEKSGNRLYISKGDEAEKQQQKAQ